MRKFLTVVTLVAALAVVVPQADAHVRRHHHRHYASTARIYVGGPGYGRYPRSYYDPYYGGYSPYYGSSYGAYRSPYYGFYGGFPSIGFSFGGGHHFGGHHYAGHHGGHH